MHYILIVVSIILLAAMIAFLISYCYLVIKFYRKVWEDKTLLDEYMKQRYGISDDKDDEEQEETK